MEVRKSTLEGMVTMQNILITGNLGYIGPIMTKTLKNAGFLVTGMDANWFKGCCLFPLADNHLPNKQIYKDIRQAREEDLDNIDAVIHLAALSNDPLGELNHALTDEVNFKSTIHLAELCKKRAVKKFIFASSCSVYGIAKTDSPICEEDALNPITAYAKAKINSEAGLHRLADANFHPVFLRNATVYGASPKTRLDLVVNNLTAYAYLLKEITILSDGSPWRPIVHIEDFCQAFLLCLKAPIEKIHCQAFNVGDNTQNFRVRDIANEINKLLPDSQIIVKNETGSDERSYRVDFSKIKREIPEFEAKWTLINGIKQLIKIYKEQNLTLEGFNSERFFRIRTIKSLISSGCLNTSLIALK